MADQRMNLVIAGHPGAAGLDATGLGALLGSRRIFWDCFTAFDQGRFRRVAIASSYDRAG